MAVNDETSSARGPRAPLDVGDREEMMQLSEKAIGAWNSTTCCRRRRLCPQGLDARVEPDTPGTLRGATRARPHLEGQRPWGQPRQISGRPNRGNRVSKLHQATTMRSLAVQVTNR
ncbi:MAG: hypothetical protein ACJAYU_002580 [Bradymonadia bacterium]|jgi:hypothetical protein